MRVSGFFLPPPGERAIIITLVHHKAVHMPYLIAGNLLTSISTFMLSCIVPLTRREKLSPIMEHLPCEELPSME